MRIIIHTQFYPPEMGAPQARLSDLARRLVILGHSVEVLTAMPNYPTGRVFEGYPRFFMEEKLDGITVRRSWIIPSKKISLAHRLLSYLSFSLSSLIVGLIKSKKPDIIITESPPLFLAAAGWMLAKAKGSNWILNVSDLWPDSAKYIGMIEESALPYRLMRFLAHFLYRKACLVTGQSREIIGEVQAQVPEARVYHLSNGVDISGFGKELRRQDIRDRYLKQQEVGFVFAGLHGLFQGLDQLITAADRLRDIPARFILLGDGAEKEKLVKAAEQLGLKNIDFYPPVKHAEIPSIVASMDVAVITLKSAIRGAVPSKIYEAMASAIPILLVAEGEARDIVLKSDAGIAVQPSDIDSLVAAIRRLSAAPELRLKMGISGRQAAEKFYDRMTIAADFNAVIKDMGRK